MKIILYSWPAVFALMLVLDSIWLSIMAPRFYFPYLSAFYNRDFDLASALMFYVIYSFCISYVIVDKAAQLHLTSQEVFMNGFLFGLAAYGAYDLTNQATMKNWPVIVTIVDMLWGAFVTGIVSMTICKFAL